MDNLPYGLKILFSIGPLNLMWGLYRLFKGIDNNNVVLLIAGIVWTFAGWTILWIIDLITIIIYGRPIVFVY